VGYTFDVSLRQKYTEIEFTGNMTWVSGQIGLLGTTGVTGMDTQVRRQIGLLRTAGVIGTAARVSLQIGLLGSASVTETATQSLEILAGVLWKAEVRISRLTVTPHVSKPHDYVNHMFMRL
jgi:hypothetical protein